MTRVRARTFALMALLDGCSDEESGSAIYGAALVWSDDDSTMLIAERDFSYVGHDEESTMQLLLLDPAAAARTVPLGEPFDADTVELYLMMQAGYALVPYQSKYGNGVLQTFLDGEQRLLSVEDLTTELPECGINDALPSPDGSMIALDLQCDDTLWNDTEHVVIDALSGAMIVELIEHGRGQWTPAGEYIITGYQAAAATKWTPGVSGTQTIPAPECRWPRTSSSDTKEDGEYASLLDVHVPPYVEYSGELSRRQAFGCP